MKSFIVIASSLLLCSCADMVVTKSYVSNSGGGMVDAKDVGSIRYETNCGVGAAHPSAIYIRPFCIDSASFYDGEAASEAEMPIRQQLVPIAFAGHLKEQLGKMAPALVIADNEVPKVGWLVEGSFGNVNSSVSSLSMHVKVTDVESHRVIYEFDMAGGNNGQGVFGSVRGSGGRFATPFDLRNAAERVLLVLSPDAFGYGARTSVALH